MIWEQNRQRDIKIKYFDHSYHLLSLSNRKRDDSILCEVCYEPCDGQTYICSKGCYYNLYESCAKLPLDVQSPIHPHPLILGRVSIEFYRTNNICDCCYKGYKGFVYRCCDDCNFQLDRECAFMRPVKVKEEDEEGQERLICTHPHHDHSLLLEKVPVKRCECVICLKYCSDSHTTYGCIPCCLFLHEGSCFKTKLPPHVDTTLLSFPSSHPHSYPIRSRFSMQSLLLVG